MFDELFGEYVENDILESFQDLMDDYDVKISFMYLILKPKDGNIHELCRGRDNIYHSENNLRKWIYKSGFTVKYCYIKIVPSNYEHIYDSNQILEYLDKIKFCLIRLPNFSSPQLKNEVNFWSTYDFDHRHLPPITIVSTIKSVHNNV